MRYSPVVLIGCLLLGGCNPGDIYEGLPAAGAAVPAFNLPTLDGRRISSAELTGRPTVLALWSTDCGASRLALQGIAAMQRDYGTRGVRVLVIADDADPAHRQAVMDSAGVQVPVAYAAGEIYDLFDPERHPWERSFGLPSWLVLNAHGQVAERMIGVLRNEVEGGDVRLENVRAAVERVLVSAAEVPASAAAVPTPAA